MGWITTKLKCMCILSLNLYESLSLDGRIHTKLIVKESVGSAVELSVSDRDKWWTLVNTLINFLVP
jgi:hypothetical protein